MSINLRLTPAIMAVAARPAATLVAASLALAAKPSAEHTTSRRTLRPGRMSGIFSSVQQGHIIGRTASYETVTRNET